MLGYTPRILPSSYTETRGFGNLNAGFLDLVGGLVGGAFQAGTTASQEFNAATAQIDAQELAAQRSRRWAAFGAVAVGIAGLAGVVYLLRK